MGVCQICGASFGMFGGGEEPYTGAKLQICNSCGAKLKEIDSEKKKGNQSECMKLVSDLLALCKDEEISKLINEYLGNIYKKIDEMNTIQKETEVQTQKMREIEEKFLEYKKQFKTTTGYNFDGYRIAEYKGIVSGEVVLGTGFISEYAASFSDLFGTQSNTFAKKMSDAKQGALNNLITNALLQGANALIGVDFDYITFNNNILGVSANGTAVVIQREEE